MKDKVVAVNESVEGSNIIGYLVYYTIGKTMLPEERVFEILDECGIGSNIVNKKHTNTQAFKTATSKVQTGRIIGFNKDTNTEDVFKIRIFDNRKEDDGTKIVREIKKESVLEKTNKFLYLGNFVYDKLTDKMSYSLVTPNIENLDYDIRSSCEMAMKEFEIEKHGFNEDRLATLVDNYMADQLEGSRVQIHGKIWFVPQFKSEELIKLINFIKIVSNENQRDGTVEIMDIKLMDEKKYVERYSREFHVMAQNELNIYQKKLSELIKNPSTRSSTIDVWLNKAQQFIEKKKRYEELFKKEIEDMDDDLAIMDRQIKELEIRMSKKQEGVQETK